MKLAQQPTRQEKDRAGRFVRADPWFADPAMTEDECAAEILHLIVSARLDRDPTQAEVGNLWDHPGARSWAIGVAWHIRKCRGIKPEHVEQVIASSE